jgi:hypothetical protein
MSRIVVRVCTFNLRSDESDIGTPNEWDKRRPIVQKCLENMRPTIIGTQEGGPSLLNDILVDLNKYTLFQSSYYLKNKW